MRNLRTGVLFFIFSTFITFGLFAQRTNQLYWSYIDKYKELAIDQMERYRIPASITLAQGLLESGAGRSTLATEAHNHFGIKVGGSWTGPYVLRDDDRPNEKFRKYKNDAESYEDHSKFLQGRRYQSLFSLKITDYQGWAKGLKAAGYATNPTYATQLIHIIEMYNLAQFDTKKSRKSNAQGKEALNEMTGGLKIKMPTEKKEVEELSLFFQHHQVLKNNGIYFIIVEVGDDMATISKETGISLKKLYAYNDLHLDYAPTAGDVIYLGKKKKEASKDFRDYPIHVVEENQSIFDIAQLYGIRLEYLYKLNQWDNEHSILPGDIIRIR
ncbi:MAG: glucosaminidase domain-containing protein [Bacteroidaceae bacterium]|nr:glucosaminidase domain-containing protein [Bacteroidaceae bacterium]